jgi:hypothetical protein
MIKKIGERLAEGMGFIGGIHSLFETFGKLNESLSPELKQKFPGFLGLSLIDEQIFNGVLGQIDVKKQVLINNFLYEKCKNYERNRFINIVAGMEVIEEGKKEETVNSFDDNDKKVIRKTIESGRKNDTRKKFLESFADVITSEFGGDLQKAYEFCIGGKMIISDPLHQKALRAFSESAKWFRNCANAVCEKTTENLRKTSIGKEYKSFWSAAFPKMRQAIAFGIFAAIVIIMLASGLIFS